MWTHMHTGWKISKCNNAKNCITNLAITRPKKTVTTQGKNPKQANMHTKRECMQDHAMCTPKCINGAFKPQPNLANGRLPTFWQITGCCIKTGVVPKSTFRLSKKIRTTPHIIEDAILYNMRGRTYFFDKGKVICGICEWGCVRLKTKWRLSNSEVHTTSHVYKINEQYFGGVLSHT